MIKLCSECYREIHKGKAHKCKNRSTYKLGQNVLNLVNKLPENEQERIASLVIKKKTENSSLESNNKILELQTTGGKKRKIVLDTKKSKKIKFTENALDNFQVNTGSSYNEMKKLTNFLRSNAGKNSVPKYYEKHASTNSKLLENLYKQGTFDFDVENKEKKEKRPVVWADVEELLESVLEKRNLVGMYEIIVTADGGQGFFKICLTITPEDYSPNTETDDNFDEDEYNHKLTKKRRKLYSEGGTTARKAKLTSVHRLIMLCIVPQIKES